MIIHSYVQNNLFKLFRMPMHQTSCSLVGESVLLSLANKSYESLHHTKSRANKIYSEVTPFSRVKGFRRIPGKHRAQRYLCSFPLKKEFQKNSGQEETFHDFLTPPPQKNHLFWSLTPSSRKKNIMTVLYQ